MNHVLVKLAPDQLQLLRQQVGRLQGEDSAPWAAIMAALDSARQMKDPFGRGRRAAVSDEALLAAYERVGTIRGVCQTVGYADHYWVSKRLRELGVEVHRGRPRKRPP